MFAFLPPTTKHPTTTHFKTGLSLTTNNLTITVTRAASRHKNPRTSIPWAASTHAVMIENNADLYLLTTCFKVFVVVDLYHFNPTGLHNLWTSYGSKSCWYFCFFVAKCHIFSQTAYCIFILNILVIKAFQHWKIMYCGDCEIQAISFVYIKLDVYNIFKCSHCNYTT